MKGIEPLHPEIKPPQGAEPAGVHPMNGKQLYKVKRERAVIGDKLDPDTGRVEHRQNVLTGEQMHKIREVKGRETIEKLVYLESEGNGNIRMVEYTPATEEEIQRAHHERQVEDMQRSLAEELVNSGLSPDQIVERLRDEPTQQVAASEHPQNPVQGNGEQVGEVTPAEDAPDLPEPDEEPEGEPEGYDPGPEPEDIDNYPKPAGPGMWLLSDGSKAGGPNTRALNRDAAAKLEKQVQQARAERYAKAEAKASAAATPEV